MAKRRALVACGWLLCVMLAQTPSMVWGLGTPPRERAVPAAPRIQTLLVVPARYTVVQMAFDIQTLRPVELVAYDDQAPATDPVIHFWDRDVRDWIRIDIEQFRAGALFKLSPAESVIVGTDQALPPGLLDAAGGIPVRKRVVEMNLAQIANAVNESHAFSAQEWQWLAVRYRLKLKDLNYERRRYGRFGKPDTARRHEESKPRAEREEALPPPMKIAPQPRRSEPDSANDREDAGLSPAPDGIPPVPSVEPEPPAPLPEPVDLEPVDLALPDPHHPEIPEPREKDIPPEDK